MWREVSTHEKGETEYLDRAIERISLDRELYDRAEALLSGAAKSEPLLADTFRAPQDVRYHAEGPVVRDHLRLQLMVLYALESEKLHLIDIEEFRRMRGYEGEFDELEEMIKENIAFFEVFALCHDAAKWASTTFSAPDGSRGDGLGFNPHISYRIDGDYAQRTELLKRYLELYARFEEMHPNESRQRVQALFYQTYEIQVHNPNHGRMIHLPVYLSLLDRFVVAHKLPSHDRAILEDLIAHHLQFIKDFTSVRFGAVDKYYTFAEKRGYDADDYFDLAQGALFLDAVCASTRLSAHGPWHEVELIENSFKAQHEFAPQRRANVQRAAEERRNQKRNKVFREVGLDGNGLMELLDLRPGAELGKALKSVQRAVIGKAPMPRFSPEIDQELSMRAGRYYQEMFKQGE